MKRKIQKVPIKKLYANLQTEWRSHEKTHRRISNHRSCVADGEFLSLAKKALAALQAELEGQKVFS